MDYSKNFHQTFSYIINDVLKVSGYQISRDCNISQSGVYSIVQGRSLPGAEFISKFCNTYNISANYLLLNIEPIRLDIKSDYKSINSKNQLSNKFDQLIEILNQIKDEI